MLAWKGIHCWCTVPTHRYPRRGTSSWCRRSAAHTGPAQLPPDRQTHTSLDQYDSIYETPPDKLQRLCSAITTPNIRHDDTNVSLSLEWEAAEVGSVMTILPLFYCLPIGPPTVLPKSSHCPTVLSLSSHRPNVFQLVIPLFSHSPPTVHSLSSHYSSLCPPTSPLSDFSQSSLCPPTVSCLSSH